MASYLRPGQRRLMGSSIGLCLVSMALLLGADAIGALLNTNQIVRWAVWASVVLVTVAAAVACAAGFWVAVQLIQTHTRARRRPPE